MTAETPTDDGALAGRSLAGDDAAFAEIMRRHRAAIYRLALGITGDPEAALDLTQDSFVAAYRNLARYDSARPFRPWLTTIALNRCRDWRRRQRVRLLLSFATDPQAAIDAAADDAPDAERQIAGRTEIAALSRQIGQLPTGLREVLLLRTVEGLSQAETAEALGITIKAVETRLVRARTMLAEKVGRV